MHQINGPTQDLYLKFCYAESTNGPRENECCEMAMAPIDGQRALQAACSCSWLHLVVILEAQLHVKQVMLFARECENTSKNVALTEL